MADKDTGRIEALSDGIFGVALTLLAIELKAPELKLISNKGLFTALLSMWPQYLTILNSFASVLLMWVGHHSFFKLIRKASIPFTVINGLLLLLVTLTIFSTKTLSAYLLTDAAKTAAAFYAFTNALLSGAFNLLWYQALKERNILQHNIDDKTIKIQSRSYLSGLLIYVFATGAAFINEWITVGICTATWIFWIASFKKTESS